MCHVEPPQSGLVCIPVDVDLGLDTVCGCTSASGRTPDSKNHVETADVVLFIK